MRAFQIIGIFMLTFAAWSRADSTVVTHELQTDHSIGLANGSLSLEFDRGTGALTSLKNLATSDEYLKKQNGGGNPFRVHLDAGDALPPTAPNHPGWPVESEDAKGGTIFSSTDCKLVESSFRRDETSGVLRLVSRHPGSGLSFILEVSVPDNDVTANLKLVVLNDGADSHRVMTAMPHFTGLALGSDPASNRALRLVGFGQSRAPAWVNQGDIYGRNWAAQFQSVYEPSRDEGLGVISLDKDLRNKVVRRSPGGGISFFYFDDQKLDPGQSIEYPTAQIIVHRGDWKIVARRYGDWFRSNFAPRPHAKWLDDVDMFVGSWVPSPEDVAKDKEHPEQPAAFTSYANLDRMFLQAIPGERCGGRNGYYDLKELAQYWQGVIRYHRYDAYHHSDGIYDIREDLGGVQVFKEGISRVNHDGRIVGLYVASMTMRNDSEFFKLYPNTKPQDWLLMETPDAKLPPPDKDGQQSFYMCPRNRAWQDHLAGVIKRLLKETGAKYVRLDELGSAYLVCHNPAHHHANPWNGTPEMLQLLKKIRAAMDEVDPDAALFSEGATDMFSQYTDGTLAVWSAGTDIAPMRLITPEFVGLSYHFGQVDCALNGFITTDEYACSRDGFANGYFENLWGFTGIESRPKCYLPPAPPDPWGQWPGEDRSGPASMNTGKLRWHELGHTFVEAVRHGDPTDANPVGVGLDPEDFAARLWRSPKYWLMVGGNRAAIQPAQPVRVKLPELPHSINSAYEIDAATLKMRDAHLERKPDGIFVTMTAGFSAVLLPMPDCPPLLQMDDPPILSNGRPLELKLSWFAPWRKYQQPVEVSVEVPGLTVTPAKLTLPGTVTVSAQAGSEGGAYFVTATGDCLRLKRWLQFVPMSTSMR